MLSSSWQRSNSAISAPLNTYNSQPMKILSVRANSLPEGVSRLFFFFSFFFFLSVPLAQSVELFRLTALRFLQIVFGKTGMSRNNIYRRYSMMIVSVCSNVNMKIRNNSALIRTFIWWWTYGNYLKHLGWSDKWFVFLCVKLSLNSACARFHTPLLRPKFPVK